MKVNMGSLDKRIRFIVGIIIIAAGIYFQSWWGAVGLVFLLTASMSWCPAYLPFKFSTIKKSDS